jgi:predicted metal-binding membrane protein
MLELFFTKVPWQLRALCAWFGTLAGILLLFAIGRQDFVAAHPVEQQLFTFAGWGLAFWGPVALVTLEGQRIDD